jgi:hypothetical protein
MPSPTGPTATTRKSTVGTNVQPGEGAKYPTSAVPAEAQEAKETLDIPAELVRREKRVAALKQARQVIEQRAKEIAAAQQEDYKEKQAKRQAQRQAGQKPRGPEPTPPSETPDPKAQYNFTDPQSRIMKAGNGQHFEQSCRKLRGLTRRPLYDELVSSNPEALLEGDHYIACPQQWFTDLLERFYGCHLDFDHSASAKYL